VKGLLKALAPTLVNVATSGNPVAGVAIKLAAKKLGIGESASIQDIENHIEQNPEKIELVKNAENEIRAMEINLEEFKVKAKDAQHAREIHKGEKFPIFFGSVVLIGFFAYVFLITVNPPAQADLALSNLILGNLFAVVSGISGYLYGQQNGKK
tara:strand:- start:97 stop:558 length:462 start_codon:yes stop_codon:yes gene_type:complete